MEKIKVLVSGCNGHMGKLVCRLIGESDDMCVLYGFDIKSSISDFPFFNNVTDLANAKTLPDIIIDFSSPKCTLDLLENYAGKHHIPMVIGTTGFSDDEVEIIKSYAKKFPIFLASNMSYSVALLEELLRELAPKLSGYDIEIVETHHNRKKDAPSGTAKTLANAMAEALSDAGNDMSVVYGRSGKRELNEIGISALRGGNIVGTHTINFYGQSDTLSITHTALSREMFAEGAVKAARFVINQIAKGCIFALFTMKDLM